jgi:uncharacterized protein YndB with AHSA1/START domain
MIRPLRAIVLEARFDASPADVWHALTDADALSNWFAPFMKAGQNVGGIVEMSWDGTNVWPTTIEIWEPERHLRWADPAPSAPPDGRPQPRLMVDWLISTDRGQTVLHLVHSGFGEGARWDDQVDGTLGGWTYFLWNMEACLTRHRGVRRAMVSARKRVSISRTQFWDALFASGLVAVPGPDVTTGQPCTLTLGRTFDAVVQTFDAPVRFAARIPLLEDALLFIELEGGAPDGFPAGFWLSTYGLDAGTVGELQRALDAAVERLTQPNVAWPSVAEPNVAATL